MSKELVDEIPIWVLVVDKIATLEDLESRWSLDDMMRAYGIIEYRSHVENQRISKNNVNNKVASRISRI